MMKVIEKIFDDVLLIKPNVFEDSRGYFYESFNMREFSEACNRNISFFQDNHSLSAKNVLRGLHYQRQPYEQGKLIRVIRGSIYDVIVNLNLKSSYYMHWRAFDLNSTNKNILWIPEGYAHGYLSLEDNTEITYKATMPYNKESSVCISYNDEDLGIEWPSVSMIMSEQDKSAISFKTFQKI
tara:strand:+ start:21141 stop:21686 length:546 start_codon:yes stop_codon:yes gene_type:complete